MNGHDLVNDSPVDAKLDNHHYPEVNGGADARDAENKLRAGPAGILNGVVNGVLGDKTHNTSTSIYEPIAIIGCAMRLPGGVNNGEALWNLLDGKREGRCRVPKDRYNIDAFYGPGKEGHIDSEYGYFLDHINLAEMDTSFWSMSRNEIGEMDPRQRLALEVAYDCLQNSGTTEWRGKSIGVYMGIFEDDWTNLAAKETQNTGIYRLSGYGDYFVANRISYELGFQGPSMVIRTACSSSLTGLHEACVGLQRGECESAIVGGANLIFNPDMTIAATGHGILSPDGRCKTFDESANGYARGEGVVAIHVKRLSDAVRDNDPIRAVIRASSINSDGRAAALSQPSSASHEALMRRTHKLAGIVDVSKTAMIECHGTGTSVGDPLESKAVARVFGERGIYIGSVKPNLGHSEGASGITAVIKMVLALEKRLIPPNINFKTPSSKIPFKEYNLKVPVETLPWPEDRAERVGVNSYGIGGANAQILLESASSMGIDTARQPLKTSQNYYLLTFSANHPDALKKVVDEHEAYLEASPERIADLSYTLNVRREQLPHRAFSIVQADAIVKPMHISKFEKIGMHYDLTYVFTGQGAQWARMGAGLLESNPTFRTSIEEMDLALANCADPPTWSLADELMKPEKNSRLPIAEFSQPCCTAIQVALVNVLRQWGLKPSSVVGHSSGEIAAAYAGEALTADEAIRIAYYRGRVTKKVVSKGGMTAVGLGRSAVTPLLKPGVIIGCENSPESVTLSGDLEIMQEVVESIKEAFPETFVRKLRVDTAYHSHHMKAIVSEYATAIGPIPAREVQVAFFSSVAGAHLGDRHLDATYWTENLVSPVLFSPAVSDLFKHSKSCQMFLEIGPHSAMAGPLRQIFRKNESSQSEYVPTLIRGENAISALLNCAGTLFQRDIGLKFDSIAPAGSTLVDLPTYPWQREGVYWNESRLSKDYRFRKFPKHDILGARVHEASDFDPTWRNLLRLDDVPWIRDHDISRDIVFPGAGYVAMAGEAIRQLTGSTDFTVRDVSIGNALVMHEGAATEVITHLNATRHPGGPESVWYDFHISSLNGETWVKHAAGQVRGGSNYESETPQIHGHNRHVDSSKWYSVMKRFGLNYGPRFQGLRRITADVLAHKATAHIDNTAKPKESFYGVHPCTIDLAFQLLSVAAAKGLSRLFTQLCVPTYIEELYVKPTPDEILVEANTDATPGGSVHGNVVGVASTGTVFRLKNLKLSPIADATDIRGDNPHAAVELAWKPDISFLSYESVMRCEGEVERLSLAVERMAIACIIECDLLFEEKEPSQPFLFKFRAWLDKMRRKVSNEEYNSVPDCKDIARMSSADRCKLIESIYEATVSTESGPVSTAIHRVFHAAEDIFLGKVDALEILVKDDLLTNIYNFGQSSNLRGFLELTSHYKPNLKILEVGAGTGGTTSRVLPHLIFEQLESRRHYLSYTYTDVSSGFFASAKERFQDYEAIEYRTLDISKDPIEQGFEAGAYDLIIASNVLHATPIVTATLANVRKLLSHKGRLLLEELSPPTKWVNFIMGTLPGWWLGEHDGRIEEPYIPPPKWEQHLREAGFDGIHSFQHEGQMNAIMVALPAQPPVKSMVTMLCGDDSLSHVREAASVLREKGYELDYCKWGEIPLPDQDIVALIDAQGPFLHDLDEKGFLDFKKLLRSCKNSGILWVTGAAQVKCSDPRYGLILGMARTARTELSMDLATIELDEFNKQGWEAVATVLPEFQRRSNNGDLKPNMEWAFVDGFIQIARFQWISVNKRLSTADIQYPAGKLDVTKRGVLSSLGWKQHTPTEPEGDSVQVRSHVVGLNYKDVLFSMGKLAKRAAEGDGLGYESVGIVEKIGPDVKDLVPGDRCMVLGNGAFATSLTTSSKMCAKIPKSLSFIDAASMVVAYSTAIYSLFDMARAERDQTVLIHDCCESVGLAALQICRVIGAEIYCAVDTKEKITHLVEVYSIPRSRIFNSRDLTFQRDLFEVTDGRGVDVVLGSPFGDLLHASWTCVAEFGCLVDISEQDMMKKEALGIDLIGGNRSYFRVDLARLCTERPSIASRLLKKAIEFYECGDIKAIAPIHKFEGSRIEDAMRFVQNGDYIGKAVLALPQNPATLPLQPSKQTFKLREDASYLLVGGLGGLGQAIAIWMAEAGAREILFLSRSANDNDKYSAFVRELKALGCTAVMIRGSVVDMPVVESAIRKATRTIRGVMQASMVLRDVAFQSMSFDDWQTAVRPKVEGTWNLHNAFLKHGVDLDFFLLFSSWSGIVGQFGQANYASGNTFLDAFVQYRRCQGLPAASIDIGVVEDIGYVSRNPQVLEHFHMVSSHVLYEQDLLDSLHLMINRSRPTTVEKQPYHTTIQGDGNRAYATPGQLGLGLRSMQRLSAPNNRTVWKSDPRMASYYNMESLDSNEPVSTDGQLRNFITEAKLSPSILDTNDAVTFLATEIGKALYGLMMLDEDSLNLQDPPNALGVDSLLSIEIRSWFRQRLGLEITVLEILSSPSILDLGSRSAEMLKNQFTKLGGEGNKK